MGCVSSNLSWCQTLCVEKQQLLGKNNHPEMHPVRGLWGGVWSAGCPVSWHSCRTTGQLSLDFLLPVNFSLVPASPSCPRRVLGWALGTGALAASTRS